MLSTTVFSPPVLYLNDHASLYGYTAITVSYYLKMDSILQSPAVFNGSCIWGTMGYCLLLGSSLEEYKIGDRMFFQNQYRQYWLGVIQWDCFVLLYPEPLSSILDGLTYLHAERHMQQIHPDDEWFCDQSELPF